MADLDANLLKNLDQTLKNMTTSLQNLETELKGVKSGMIAAFNPNIVTEFSNSVRGMKIGSLIDAEKSKSDIREIDNQIRILTQERKHGRAFTLFTDEEYNATVQRLASLRVGIEQLNNKARSKAGLTARESELREFYRQERDRLYAATRRGGVLGSELNPAQMNEVVNMLAKYKALQRDISAGDQMRAAQLANLSGIERQNDLKNAQISVEQREQSERRKAEISRAWTEKEIAEKQQREKAKTDAEKASAQERIAVAEQEEKKRQQINKAWADYEKSQRVQTGDPLGDLAARRGLTGNLAALQDKSAVETYRKEQALRENLSQKERDDFVLVEQKLRESAAKRAEVQRQITADVEKEMKKRSDALEKEAIAIRKRESEIQNEIRRRTLAEAKSAYAEYDRKLKEQAQQNSQQEKQNGILEKQIKLQRELNSIEQQSTRSTLRYQNQNQSGFATEQIRREAEATYNAQMAAYEKQRQDVLRKMNILEQRELGSSQKAKETLAAEHEARMNEIKASAIVSRSHITERGIKNETAELNKQQNEQEKQYISWIERINKLREKNASSQSVLDVKSAKGLTETAEDTRLKERMEARSKEITNIQDKLNNTSVNLSEKGSQRIEQEESRHADRMAEIAQQSAQRIQQIEQGRIRSQEDVERSRNAQQRHEDAKARRANIQQQIQEYSNLEKQIKRYNESISRIRQNQAARTKNGVIDEAQIAKEERAIIELSRRVKELQKNLAGASSALASDEKGAAALNRYKRLMGEVTARTKQTKSSLESLLPTLRRLASAFGVAFSVQGLVNFGRKLVETRGEFELQQVALRSILQNKQIADEIWDKTMQQALQSRFSAMQLTKYTKQLAAYRIETDKLFDTTKRIADVSAGLGVDMQRLILAYGQVKAANYLRASEIRQFTEAGVNVLGELRDYFNEVKGMSVDTAKVMDMVQKRLVTFSDVEAIFKRMTDQGGIFYDMQYVQSQTVRGQIAKLHDAYDQMLNSIGQANEGVLKNMVSLLNSIVKNWQEWKTVLDLIAWPLIISFVYKFSRGLMTIAASAVATSASMNKLTVAGAKTQLMFKRLFASIAAHPFIALCAAVAAVGVALLNHAKHVRDINKRYEDLMLRTYETQKNLNGLSETIQNNLDAMKEAAKGSKEYNEASRENENIVKKLKDQYPELLQDIDLQKEGYGKLIEKIKEYNEELENQIRLEYAARAGFGQDDLTTNIADLQEAQRKREMQFLQNRELAERRYLELKAQGKEAEEDIWNRRIRLAKDWQEQVDIINQQNKAARGSQNPYGEGFSIGDWSLQMRGFVVPIGDVERNKANLSSNIKQEALVFNDIIRDQLKTIKEDLGDDIQKFITDNETQINELFKDKEGAGWKLLNKQITKFFTAKGATDKESREAIQELLNKYLLIPIQLDWDNTGGTSGNQQPIVNPTGSEAKESVSAMISLIKEMNSEYDKLSKSAYGFAQSQDKVTDSFRKSFEQIFRVRGGKGTYINYDDIDFTNKAGAAKALQAVFDQIENARAWGKFAKNAKDEMQKAISGLEVEADIEVKARIRENFGRQMEEAFGDFQLTLDLEKLNLPHNLLQTMFDIEAVDLAGMRQKLSELSKTLLDENGVMNDNNWKLYNSWLNKIEDKERDMQRQRLKDYSKYLEYQLSERAKLEMEYTKKVAEVQSESAFNDDTRARILRGLQEEYDKKIAKQDWEDFKGSEMYVEMMEDLTRQGTASLEEMRKKLVEVRDNSENLSPRALKEVVNALQKIDEVVDSRVSPFARIKDLGKDLKDAMKESGFDNMRDVFAADEDAKRSYQELKDEYDEIQAVIGAKQQEKEIEEQLGEYRNSSIASLQDLINKKKEEKKSEDKAIASLGERDKSNQQEIESRTQVSNALQGEIDKYESIIKLLKQLEKAQKTIRESSKYGNTDLGLLSVYSDTHKEQMKAAENTTKRIDNITRLWQRLRKAMHEFLEATKKYITQGQQAVSSVYNTIKELGVEVHEIGDQWESLINTLVNGATSIIDAVDKVKDASDSATEATAQAASGQWVKFALTILSVLAQTIGEIAKFRGAIVNKEIREQGEEIADLQAAYDRLERAIKKTFTTATYIGDYNRQIANLRQQISATEAQLAAAKDRKIQDQSEILGYETAINELYDSIEDLQNEMRETFGGVGESSYRSAAEGFVSAWKDAFLETGNGLKGLQDHFDEFLQDWFVKQGTMQAVANYYSSVWDYVNDIVKDGVLPTQSQIDKVREMANEAADKSDAYLQAIAGIFNLGGEGSLSGLAASIQGMTEEKADILAGYWNSVRLYTASIDMNVAAIASILGAGSTPETNPMLTQMRIVARNTANINNLLQSVVRGGHPMGQSGIKVFINQ